VWSVRRREKENVRFGKLVMNPAKNPGILDTATWAPGEAWSAIQSVSEANWQPLRQALQASTPGPNAGRSIDSAWESSSHLRLYPSSYAHHQGADYCLAELPDGQQVFLATGDLPSEAVLGAPVGVKPLQSGGSLALHPTDAGVVDRYFRFIKPEKGPQALGAIPRLGIGTRMTTAVWPGIWRAMADGHFAAIAIQNSVRELNLLENLLTACPAERNMAFNFGTIETGYTGSTYEGLWVAGVLDALKRPEALRYGADADHIQVKRGVDGLARAKRLVEASRYYSFFTLDVSDVLNYGALIGAAPAAVAAEAYWDELGSPAQRQAICAYHQRSRRVAGQGYHPTETELSRLVGKHGKALDVTEELCGYISSLKAGVAFDLELSIDEHPPEVATFDCLTSETELTFLLLEAQRRGIPLTHVAPNLGIEKGNDYRCPDGLEGLEARTRSLGHLTEEFGVMLDVHSGDDLSAATRQALGRATAGRVHFKISPSLQLLYAEVLADYHPALFRQWWQDALAYAQREAAAGSAFAAECIEQSRGAGGLAPSSHDAVFHHYSFAFVGRRNPEGQFLVREEFYDLSPDFYRAYQDRLVAHLTGLAAELL
jgi:hypothetical protein